MDIIPTTNTLPTAPLTLSQAIAREEGWYKDAPGCAATDRPEKNNNPGDLEYSEFSRAHGATGTDGRFAIFPDTTTGFNALIELLQSSGYFYLSIADAISRYAPASENATETYISNVCQWTDNKSTDIVRDVRI